MMMMDEDYDDVTPITRSLDDDSRFDTHQLNTPTTTTVQQRLDRRRRSVGVARALSLSLTRTRGEL